MPERLTIKNTTTFLFACSLVAVVTMACAKAGGIDGKWIAQLPAREGQTRETTFNFKAGGNKLTGTVSGRQGDWMTADSPRRSV